MAEEVQEGVATKKEVEIIKSENVENEKVEENVVEENNENGTKKIQEDMIEKSKEENVIEEKKAVTEEKKYKKVKAEKVKVKRQKISWKTICKQKALIFMSIPFVLYALVFYYLPLGGWVMAFQNYKPKNNVTGKGGIFGSEFVGLGKFKQLFSNDVFLKTIKNTLGMSLINLVLGFIFSIGFALMLNEVCNKHGKKFVQTVSYLPHFLSWIIVTGLVHDVLAMENGIINQILQALGIIDDPLNYLAYPKFFWWIVGFANVWKETGWGSIIYLAAMTAINPDTYEAAAIDGAGRFRKMWHVTLPGIRSTILILLIINIGNILNAGFEVQYLLGNGLVQEVSQTIDIYVLKYGINQSDFSIGTAAGIFKSGISIILVCLANQVSKWFGEERLF